MAPALNQRIFMMPARSVILGLLKKSFRIGERFFRLVKQITNEVLLINHNEKLHDGFLIYESTLLKLKR